MLLISRCGVETMLGSARVKNQTPEPREGRGATLGRWDDHEPI